MYGVGFPVPHLALQNLIRCSGVVRARLITDTVGTIIYFGTKINGIRKY